MSTLQRYGTYTPGKLTVSKSAPTKKARFVTKKKVRSTTSSVVRIGRQPFPKILYNTLSYAVKVAMAVTAGSGGYVISANGLFKPDPLTSTAQPLYFDQLTAVYDHYAVVGSRCKFTPLSASNLNVVYAAFVDDDSTIPAPSATNVSMLTRPGSKSSFVGNFATDRPHPVMCSYNQKSWFGGDLLASGDQQGTSAANPTETVFHVFQYFDIAVGSYNLDLIIQVEYDVVWDELFTVAQS